jgi:DUF3000 family protein
VPNAHTTLRSAGPLAEVTLRSATIAPEPAAGAPVAGTRPGNTPTGSGQPGNAQHARALSGSTQPVKAKPVEASADEAMFRLAVGGLEAGLAQQRSARAELVFDNEPAPRRLAPFAAAIAASVMDDDNEIGWGKFVLLFDPAGQEAWAGQYRIIAYVRTELDPEIAADPMIAEVGWSWLLEALDATAAGYGQTSGTVTRVVTEGFGAKQDEPMSTGFELRASWSPGTGEGEPPGLEGHVAAWCDALCTAAGLPPLGVSALRPPGRRRQP